MERISEENFIEFNLIRNSVSFEKSELFALYLKDVYEDLLRREEEGSDKTFPKKGIGKLVFNNYMKVPVFIAEKIFASLDKDLNGFLNEKEFSEGLMKLYLGNFKETAQIIFNVYDYDKDGVINKGDVKVLLSYLPLKSSEELGYKHQMQSLEELDTILSLTFGNKETNLLFEDFLSVIQNNKSDIYIHLLCFLYQNKPFEVDTINNYKNHKAKKKAGSITGSIPKKLSVTITEDMQNGDNHNNSNNPKLPSPCKKSNFVSTESYINQVHNKLLRKRTDSPENKPKMKKLGSIVSTSRAEKSLSPKKTANKFFSGKSSNSSSDSSPMHKANKIGSHIRKASDINAKEMIRMTNQKIVNPESQDMPLINLLGKSKDVFDSPSVFLKQSGKQVTNAVSDFNLGEKLQLVEPYEEILYHEDWVYKGEDSDNVKTKSRGSVSNGLTLDKFFMVLRGKEISLYTTEKKDDLVKFHNLSGCFIKEGDTLIKDKLKYYTFSIVYSRVLSKRYYTSSEDGRKRWMDVIKKAVGYQHFNDFYEVAKDIDQGRFGNVKLGVHKDTGEKVAIKVIKKKELTEREMELVRTELDIMKLFRHPNIVRLLDHFENESYIYIVMEYLSGGHLASYVEKQGKLTEKQAARIIFAVAQGIKYMNSFGIIHRDIKPENIMMTDSSESAGIKIIDFGLTKTLAPGEKLAEGMGTITFVAPEVITRKPYNKQVDVWSLGVILYLLLSGTLPFTHPENDEEEIAKKVVFMDVSFINDHFKGRSNGATKLIDSCLEKNPEKRITIEQVLKNDWVRENYK